ncbi:DMT family transporter [Flavimaribacter sediminis]|nr:DMT family transporter [Flavimaribacter sediminis]
MKTGSAQSFAVNELAVGRQKLLGHAAMILFAALVAWSFSLGSLAAPYLDPVALNAIRFLLGTVVMATIVLLGLRRLSLPKEANWRFFVLGGLMSVYFVTMFVALKTASPLATGAIFTLTPLMSTGFGYLFLRQTTRPVVLVSILVAACGSVWVIFDGTLKAILTFDIGYTELLFLFGCMCHAAYAPLVKKFNRGEPILLTTFWTTAATFLVIFAYGFGEVFTTDWIALPLVAWIGIVYLATMTTAVTFFLIQFASVRLPASKVLTYGLMTPVFVILYEGMLGHGWANLPILAGAAVILAGLMVIAFAPDL